MKNLMAGTFPILTHGEQLKSLSLGTIKSPAAKRQIWPIATQPIRTQFEPGPETIKDMVYFGPKVRVTAFPSAPHTRGSYFRWIPTGSSQLPQEANLNPP